MLDFEGGHQYRTLLQEGECEYLRNNPAIGRDSGDVRTGSFLNNLQQAEEWFSGTAVTLRPLLLGSDRDSFIIHGFRMWQVQRGTRERQAAN
jgi:hypothetical protein